MFFIPGKGQEGVLYTWRRSRGYSLYRAKVNRLFFIPAGGQGAVLYTWRRLCEGGQAVTAVLVVPLQLSNVTDDAIELEGRLQKLLENNR